MTPAPDRKRRVLIVEDDAPTARTLAHMLREDGYDVEVVFDGAAAIARLGRAPSPDVLVADYRLPHADGLAVATYGRSRHDALHIVMVTSYPEIVARVTREFHQPTATLTKPLAYSDLTRELERVTAAPGSS